jgi:hypothetical protein
MSLGSRYIGPGRCPSDHVTVKRNSVTQIVHSFDKVDKSPRRWEGAALAPTVVHWDTFTVRLGNANSISILKYLGLIKTKGMATA